MNTSCETVIQSLRDELQEYGALLGLFDEQQTNLLRRDADAVLSSVATIEDQTRVLQERRDCREQFVQSFAREHGAAADASLRSLTPLFPLEVQPLVSALVVEINHLIHRIRRGSRQNQILLARTIETHGEIVRMLRPDLFGNTYSQRGSVSVGTSSAWQATG